MSVRDGKGGSDYYAHGDWNAVCYECGRKKKGSTLRRHWQGYYVCPEHWEPRQPQDFVRGTEDVQIPPWTQAMPADVFVPFMEPQLLGANGDFIVTENGDFILLNPELSNGES